ncbi:hypothetical protein CAUPRSCDRAFT_12795 [Caulochytrium protostelioides]|uniref:Uncharacterized protein n=1 Tax=Caulochytrium protostelioides TaxID=1555241 RepID=A0A4P9WR23_9FUNG|nr:hypothetical protein CAUPRSCDRAFT_12795 [Caulochytrium protostelioides]
MSGAWLSAHELTLTGLPLYDLFAAPSAFPPVQPSHRLGFLPLLASLTIRACHLTTWSMDWAYLPSCTHLDLSDNGNVCLGEPANPCIHASMHPCIILLRSDEFRCTDSPSHRLFIVGAMVLHHVDLQPSASLRATLAAGLEPRGPSGLRLVRIVLSGNAALHQDTLFVAEVQALSDAAKAQLIL